MKRLIPMAGLGKQNVRFANDRTCVGVNEHLVKAELNGRF